MLKKHVQISVYDPRWIGAWWLGFLFFGAVSIVVALPLLCFPRRLVRKKINTSKTKKISCDRKHLLELTKEFPKSILRLLGNGRYMCNLTGVTIQLLVIGGMVAFNAKYIEHVFTVPTWFANMLMGSLTVLGAAFGTFIGGFVTSNFKLSPHSCIKLITTAQAVVIISTFISAFLGCPNPEIVGYNTDLFSVTNKTTRSITSNDTVIAPACYESCNCDKNDFFPVCGEDNRNYISPCYAGCTARSLSQMYTNCTCVEDGGTARPGLCGTDCNKLWPFVITAIIGAFGSTIIIIPSLIFQIRSVSEADKSMAVGVSSFAQTLFGWLPGPVVSGKIIDTCCSIWTSSCFGQGACSLYDIEALRIRRHIFELVFRSVSIVLFAIACIISRNRHDWSITSPDTQITVAPPEGTALMSKQPDMEDTHNNKSSEFSDSTILNTETDKTKQI